MAKVNYRQEDGSFTDLYAVNLAKADKTVLADFFNTYGIELDKYADSQAIVDAIAQAQLQEYNNGYNAGLVGGPIVKTIAVTDNGTYAQSELFSADTLASVNVPVSISHGDAGAGVTASGRLTVELYNADGVRVGGAATAGGITYNQYVTYYATIDVSKLTGQYYFRYVIGHIQHVHGDPGGVSRDAHSYSRFGGSPATAYLL